MRAAIPARRVVPGGWRWHLGVLALYLALTLLLTWPLAAHFGTMLPGDGRDGWQNYWDFWWLRHALASGHNPFHTDLLYAPYGVPLYLHTLNLFNGLITLPVQWAFGLTVAYNTVVVLSFVLAAYFACLLVGYISESRVAGIFGGIIYAFGAYHFAHLLGHTNLLASEWLPAYLLCLLAAADTTGRRQRWWAAGGIASLLLLMLCDWQYVLFAGLLTVFWALWRSVARRSFAPLLVAGAIGMIWLVLAAPLLVPTARELRDTAATRPPVEGPALFSADLLSFYVPSPLQTWWGQAAERLGGRAVAPVVERAVYLGYVPLALAAFGLWWRRRRVAFWGVAALVFLVLALGPTLQIAGQVHFGAGGWVVPLPYRLLERAPGVNAFRAPARFALLVTLCLAVLAGIGIAEAVRRLSALRRPRVRVMAGVALAALLLAEQWSVPYPLVAVNAPPFYRQLAASGEPGAVLELPFSITRATSLFGQTVHQHPIVGGYLSRPLAYPILDLPPFSNALVGHPDFVPPPDDDTGAWVLRYAGVRWIVVLVSDPKLNRAETADFLRRYAEPDPIYTDAQMAVYRPKSVGAPQFLLRPATGWYQPEMLADKQTRMRWLPWSATLDAWSLSDGPQTGTLRFDAWSFATPRHLAVSVDGHPAGQWLVANPQTFTVSLMLTPGQHHIEFRTLDPPQRPSRSGAGDDTRLLSIGVANVTLQGAGGR